MGMKQINIRFFNMQGWEKDKKWSDRFLPEIKQICGLHLMGEAPMEEDQQRNTDLIVLRIEAVRIACRVRRHPFFEKYPDDITIRSDRPSGLTTELAKIISGWGNYMFYGFSDDKEVHLCAWKLCDLNVFRLWFNSKIVKSGGIVPGVEKENSDGSSKLRAFNIKKMPEDFVLAYYPKSQNISGEDMWQ